ncbi:AarF/UbiB family protein [Bacteriovorax sp. DB6_IX]|uniref:AarF/UbiB family protein n=1 Tax=Bacteriovorax sp. DB6_IX TaxID=1353530 RepID=UPI000389E3BD|nr:AarF/UbiB family protein [Bacteriovorax sp. DB6_IX]EQC51939.1 ABC1 family protein [Bacteriovorax sp. DB6_IX]
MHVEYFKIKETKQTKSFGQKILSNIAQSRGATLQKFSQLFDNTENRTLKLDQEYSKKILEKLSQVSPSLYKEIRAISENFYQGSIGNIHCAKLNNGSKIAIKTTREDIEEKLFKDINNIKEVTSLTSRFVNGEKFKDLDSFANQFVSSIREECSFLTEIKNYDQLSKIFDSFEVLTLPQLYKKYSNDNVIVFDWVDATDELESLSSKNIEFREKLQYELNALFLKFPLVHGLCYEDSNLSNYLLADKKLFLIDYGKLTFIPLKTRLAIVKIIDELLNNGDASFIDLYNQMGFNKEVLSPASHILRDISKILLAPFLCETKFDLRTWEPTQKIDNIAHNLKWNIRSSAPYQYFSMTRSFFGYLKLSKMINAKTNNFPTTKELLHFYKDDIETYIVNKERPPKLSVYEYHGDQGWIRKG